MKSSAKSSITLPPAELKQVERLQRKLGAKSKVEVIRQGLRLLSDQTERDQLRSLYRQASLQAREVTVQELEDLDGLSDEGLD